MDAAQSTRAWFSTVVREFDSRHLPGGLTGLEVGVVLLEAGDARPDAVGELQDEGVVVLDGVVVALAGHSDAVLRARQLILQAHELLAGAQLRVVFREQQQAANRPVELPVGRDLGRRTLRIQHARARVGDVAEDRALFLGEPLHRLHQVGNQIGAPLQLHIDLGPLRLHRLILGHHLVLGANITASNHKQAQNQNTHNAQRN